MLACDLHVHSNFSKDGESSIEEILKRAEEAGLDAIAITDHDSVDGVKRALACTTTVLVIPGIEVSTKQGHLLVLGVTDLIPAGLDVIVTVEIARRMGALAILPHPYHMWRHGVARRKKAGMDIVDAVEVFNSRYIVGSANTKAARIAKPTMHGLSGSGGRLSIQKKMCPRSLKQSGPEKSPAVEKRPRCARIPTSRSTTHGRR
jgi:predicted metal-dependent phosphoesterase TrpH